MNYLSVLHPIVLFRIVGYLHSSNKQHICALVFAFALQWTHAVAKRCGLLRAIFWYIPIVFIHILLNLDKPYFIFQIPCHDLVPFFLSAFGFSMSLAAVGFYFLQKRCNIYFSHLISAVVGVLSDEGLSAALLLEKFAPAKVWMMVIKGTKLKLMALAVSIIGIIILNYLYQLFKKHVAPKLGMVYSRSFTKETTVSKQANITRDRSHS